MCCVLYSIFFEFYLRFFFFSFSLLFFYVWMRVFIFLLSKTGVKKTAYPIRVLMFVASREMVEMTCGRVCLDRVLGQ